MVTVFNFISAFAENLFSFYVYIINSARLKFEISRDYTKVTRLFKGRL